MKCNIYNQNGNKCVIQMQMNVYLCFIDSENVFDPARYEDLF